MGTKRAGEQNIRSLTANKTGTYQLSLPIGLVRELRWQRGQKLEVRRSGSKLIIEDWKK